MDLLRATGAERRESAPDGDWAVRSVSATAATKAYWCPGCGQQIPPGMPHVVAWRAGGQGEDRRHWHSSCWSKRADRSTRPPRR
ncbi:hypothetical protein J4H86_11260 [Spiractinospora alimapuensis]|nr:hypothetical protein J4H86_11260 [Spiractinospora alimapuensis]